MFKMIAKAATASALAYIVGTVLAPILIGMSVEAIHYFTQLY